MEDGRVKFEGWVLNPEFAIDEVVVSVGGQRVEPQRVFARGDVGKVFHMIAHAEKSGFSVDMPAGALRDNQVAHIEVEGRQGEQPVGKYFGVKLAKPLAMTFPPAHLMQRVSGTTHAPDFAQIGLQAAFDLMNAAEKHRPEITGKAGTRLLDYGCGCGRVAPFLMHFWPELAYHGCDIDAEAIGWDNGNLKAGAFEVISTAGPLPYGNETLSLIVGVSVMTHLSKEEQHRWLAELARVLRPGGLCLLTTHGRRVAHFNLGMAGMWPRVLEEGIVDRFADPALDGVAPPGYYRSTLQTAGYTQREWSSHFDVKEVLEAGLDGYQDLVVLAKKG